MEQALRAADAAGDTVAASQLAQAIRGMAAAPELVPSDAPVTEQAPAERPKPGVVASALQNLTQGATAGFADEMAAGVAAAVKSPFTDKTFGQEYNAQLQEERANLKASRETAPVTSTVAELAGAFLPVARAARIRAPTGPGMIGRIGRGLAGLPAWMRMAGAGAAQGAAYGAGTAGEGDVSRSEGAVEGGAVGGVLGPVAGVAAKPVINVSRRLGRLALDKITATPRRQAEREVAKALQNDLADPEAAERLQRMTTGQTPMVIADVGENTAGLARGAAAKPGPFRTDAQAMLTPRQQGQQGRLVARMPTTPTSGAQPFKDSFDDWAASRITEAKPLYEAAYAASFNASSPQMKALLQRPAMRAALKEAERQIGNEAGIKGGNVQRLDLAKRVLDDEIGQANRNGRNNEARMLGNIKTELLTEMDRQVPAYAQARATFAGEAAVRDAGSLGSDLFSAKITHDDARRAVADMTASEVQAFRRGALRSLVEKLEQTPETRNAAGRLIESVAMRDKMRLLFPDQQQFERFVQQASDEAQMSYTRNKVLGGSPTARIMEEGKALTSAGEVLKDAATGNHLGLFSRFLRTLGIGEMSQDTLQELSKLMLQQQDPRVISRISSMATTPRLGTISPSTQVGVSALVGAEAGQQR